MRKWLVLAVGALLALSGLLFIWQGADIIQIERGWASVIAGSVALAGGVVTMAIGALIGTVERLQASLAQQGGIELPQPAERAVRPSPAPQPEPLHQPEPAPIPEPEPEEPKPAPLPEPPEPKMPAAPVLPPLTQPVRLPEPPAPVAATPLAAPVVAAAATAAGAGLFGFFSRRRKAAEPSRDEPGDEQEAPRLPDFLVRRDIVGEAPRVELQEPLEETDAAPDVQPHGSRESDESEQASPSPDSYAWLDRALAGDDKPEPAFDWLRSRAPEPSEKEPILDEEEVSEPQTEEPFEQAYLAEEPEVESEPQETASEAEPAHEAASEPAQEELQPQAPPTVVGRYSSGGSDYTLYSDGSIDAEGPEGHQHFASMVDLRAHIEAQKNG